ELGAVKPSEWVWDTVSLILNTRYNDDRTTIITTNFEDQPAAGMSTSLSSARAASRAETLGDRIGERMRSRLHELCRTITRDGVGSVEYTSTGSDFESGFLLYKALRSVFPRTYGNRLRLRFPALVKLHLENGYPRASVTTRLGRFKGRSVYYGPFLSRAAAEK